jgi:spoIIIJ-associated protein
MRNYSNQQSGKPGNSRPSGAPPRDNRKPYPRSDRNPNRPDRRPQGGPPRHQGPRPPYGSSRPNRIERPAFQGDRNTSHRPYGAWLEVEGKSTEVALQEASKRFGVNISDFKSETVDEGAKGFLGIGSKPAKIKIALKASAIPSYADASLAHLLKGMDLPDTVKVLKDSDGNTVLNIIGPSGGTLIGRHGHTLEALQYLVNKMVQRLTGDERTLVIVDVESYLERQKDKLREMALNLAQKAKETGVEVPLRPMSSKDRRVVHLALKDHEHVTTESRGEGLRRKVVIVPKVKAQANPEVNETVQVPALDMALSENSLAHEEEEKQSFISGQPEPGNAVIPEPELDDNIGNKV